MERGPRIVCAGMCNTKADEIRFLAERVEASGGEPVIMDLSLGGAVDWADVTLAEVLAADGVDPERVLASPRAEAIELVGRAGAVKIAELHERGEVGGIISWAGSVGTTTVTRVMRALPFGVPKIMLTDMASSDVSMWLGNKDIYIVNPTAEQGLNLVTRKAVANAAAAIVAMANVPDTPSEARPLAAITAYGTTTPTVRRCTDFFQARGWDTIIIHQVGVGATMEDLIRSGQITAIMDVTTGELTNDMFGSVYGTPRTWEGARLTAASEVGIPQVVCPGGLDQCAYGALETMPQRYLDEFASGWRLSFHGTGRPYCHNAGVTSLTPTLEETEEIAAVIAERLSPAVGPTAMIVPMRGWSAYDQSEELASTERGWAKGNGDGPVWLPDPDCPTWSHRATRMLAVLRERFDPDNENLDLLACDMHILDEAFAALVNRCMGDMLDGTWRKGRYRDVDGVVRV